MDNNWISWPGCCGSGAMRESEGEVAMFWKTVLLLGMKTQMVSQGSRRARLTWMLPGTGLT